MEGETSPSDTDQRMVTVEECVEFLLTQHRIYNNVAQRFTEVYPQGIYLPHHYCYMLGKRGKLSFVEVFLIERIVQKGKHYAIAWYPFQDVTQPPVRFWVSTGSTLKHYVFGFEDHISFVKCVYLALPGVGMIRLNMIAQYELPHACYGEWLTIVKDGRGVMKKRADAPCAPQPTSTLSAQTKHLLQQIRWDVASKRLNVEQKQEFLQRVSELCRIDGNSCSVDL